MTRREQRTGKSGENVAASRLRALGICMVERIGTPVKIVPGRAPIWGEKVSGDFRGILPGGRSVLVECKTVEHNLRWSDFREHQPKALTEHAMYGGLSLVVWVHSSGAYVLDWLHLTNLLLFAPGISIAPELARELDIESL